MSVLSIEQLLNGGRSDDTAVAFQAAQVLQLGALRARVAHNARRLTEWQPSRALLVCDSSAEFVVGLLSLASLGCHTILPPNTQEGTLRKFRDSVDLLVTDKHLPSIANLCVLEDRAVGVETTKVENIRIDFFTSGSTGEMKRVEKSLALLEREAATLDALWGETVQDAAVFGTVSHQHIFGLSFKVIWPLLSGRRFAAKCYFAWEALLCDLTPGAMLVTSPAHLTRLGGLPALSLERQPRLIFTAGAPLPADAVAETETIFGATPIEILGSTESSALAWRRGASANPLWKALPGIEAKANAEGLLEIRSPFVVGDGRCTLSDRVEFEADGRFHFLGRADNVIKIEGRRINIVDVERRIAALPWIRTAAVAPVPGPRLRLGVVATVNQAGAAFLEEHGKFRFVRMLRRELLQTHDAAVLPRRWRFVDQIPTDPMGKRRSRDIAALLDSSS